MTAKSPFIDFLHATIAAEGRDALDPEDYTEAKSVVVQLGDALERPSPHPKVLVSRLLAVVESPLAMAVYDREMERRQLPDADRWH